VQDTQRPAYDTSHPVNDRRQTYESLRQQQDQAASSRQVQDTQRPTRDTSRQIYDQQQMYDSPRQPRDLITAISRQGQDPQRPGHDSQWQGSHTNHTSGPGIPSSGQQEKPQGVDLTGQVRILTTPEHQIPLPIGNGSFTDVFEGEYSKVTTVGVVGIPVAVKLFRATKNDDPKKRAAVNRRLIRESNVWLRLNHPNIQPYFGHCSDLGLSVALISPLCPSGSIMRYIAINSSANKLQLIKEVAIGLKYLHSLKVIHGDLQINNVLVNEQGHAVLTDFGRAKVLGEVTFSTKLLAGSAAYMAPELFPLDDVNVDDQFSKKSDVYAFGMLCYEIFTNEPPFACHNARLDWQIVRHIHQGKRPICTTQVQRQVSVDTWELMAACWVTAPENRPSAELIVQRLH
jgi:serine/threonine protein kinase